MPPKDEGLDVRDRVRVELVGTDVERGFIDLARVGVDSVVPHRLVTSCASPEMTHNNYSGSEALSYGLKKWLFLAFQ